jgi:hypothetical protein
VKDRRELIRNGAIGRALEGRHLLVRIAFDEQAYDLSRIE